MVRFYNGSGGPGRSFFPNFLKFLYSSSKQSLPNIVQGTAFKKHTAMLIEEK